MKIMDMVRQKAAPGESKPTPGNRRPASGNKRTVSRDRKNILTGGSYSVRIYWIVFLIALMLYIIGLFDAIPRALGFILHIISALLTARYLILDLYRAIVSKKFVLDEKPLILLAILLSFLIGKSGQGALLALLFTAVSAAQEVMADFIRRRVKDSANHIPSRVTVRRGDELVAVPLAQVEEGMILSVGVGQLLPVDALVLAGSSEFDTSAVTGSTRRLLAGPGTEIPAGSVNVGQEIRLRAAAGYDDSLLGRMDKVCMNAGQTSTHMEGKLRKVLTLSAPVIAGLAIVFGFIVPIFSSVGFKDWLGRAVVLLASAGFATSLCALPVAYFVSIYRARKLGAVIKTNDTLDDMAAVNSVYFGKTGVITDGRFHIVRAVPVGVSEQLLLQYAAYALSCTTHPAADAVIAAYGQPIDRDQIARFHDQQGKGVVIQLTDKTVICAGTELMMTSVGVRPAAVTTGENVLHLTLNRTYIGYFLLDDGTNLQAEETVRRLGALGIRNLTVVTTEKKEAAEAAAGRVGISKVYAGLHAGSASDKLTALMARQKKREKSAYVGRGGMDTDMLRSANVGIKLSGVEPIESYDASNAVILPGDLIRVPEILSLARNNAKLTRLILLIAAGVKFVVILLGLLGIFPGWTAPLGDLLIAIVTMALCYLSAQDRSAVPAGDHASAAGKKSVFAMVIGDRFSPRNAVEDPGKQKRDDDFLDIQRAIEQDMDDMPDIPGADNGPISPNAVEPEAETEQHASSAPETDRQPDGLDLIMGAEVTAASPTPEPPTPESPSPLYYNGEELMAEPAADPAPIAEQLRTEPMKDSPVTQDITLRFDLETAENKPDESLAEEESKFEKIFGEPAAETKEPAEESNEDYGQMELSLDPVRTETDGTGEKDPVSNDGFNRDSDAGEPTLQQRLEKVKNMLDDQPTDFTVDDILKDYYRDLEKTEQ